MSTSRSNQSIRLDPFVDELSATSTLLPRELQFALMCSHVVPNSCFIATISSRTLLICCVVLSACSCSIVCFPVALAIDCLCVLEDRALIRHEFKTVSAAYSHTYSAHNFTSRSQTFFDDAYTHAKNPDMQAFSPYVANRMSKTDYNESV